MEPFGGAEAYERAQEDERARAARLAERAGKYTVTIDYSYAPGRRLYYWDERCGAPTWQNWTAYDDCAKVWESLDDAMHIACFFQKFDVRVERFEGKPRAVAGREELRAFAERCEREMRGKYGIKMRGFLTTTKEDSYYADDRYVLMARMRWTKFACNAKSWADQAEAERVAPRLNTREARVVRFGDAEGEAEEARERERLQANLQGKYVISERSRYDAGLRVYYAGEAARSGRSLSTAPRAGRSRTPR